MITDDPGTPGSGKWENNIALLLEHRPNEWSIETPQFDLNYGWGDHIQLTLQGGPVILKRDDHGPVSGLGGTEAAVKWRFFDEEKSGFDMSMFPRIIFNIQQSSARRGLAEDGTRFRIPFQIAKTLDRWPQVPVSDPPRPKVYGKPRKKSLSPLPEYWPLNPRLPRLPLLEA